MNDRDLRHLRRADLLELLEVLSRENDRLRKELDEANARLEAREADIAECGSLAEAALRLSGVFEAADDAACLYVRLVQGQASRNRSQAAHAAHAARRPKGEA